MQQATKPLSRGHAVVGGIVAGLIGVVVVAIVMAITALAKGQDIWLGAKGAGAPFLRERAMQPGFDLLAVLVGTISHFAVSIVWGVLFALVAYGLTKPVTIPLGAVWGIVV